MSATATKKPARVTAESRILKALSGRKTGMTAAELGAKFPEVKHIATVISHLAKDGKLAIVGSKSGDKGRSLKVWGLPA